MQTEKKVWFPAKRYGWGWGCPNCWQGWAVLMTWLSLVFVGLLLIKERMMLYLAYMVVLTIALITICYIKGEKPRWRWGKD